MEINNTWIHECARVFRLKNRHKLFATVYLSGVSTQDWRCFCFVCGTN